MLCSAAATEALEQVQVKHVKLNIHEGRIYCTATDCINFLARCTGRYVYLVPEV